MKTALVVVAVLAMICAVFAAYNPAEDMLSFESFLQQYPREYGSLRNGDVFETEIRRQIFNSNMETIRQHNARYAKGEETWFMKPNQFADLTQDEIEAKYMGYAGASKVAGTRRQVKPFQTISKESLKAQNFEPIDWKSKFQIVNQASCGSCWANAATGALHSRAQIQAGTTLPYPSRQAITSCTKNPRQCGGTGGCSGATAQLGYDYMTGVNGIATETDYPYTSGSGSTGVCKDDQFKKAYTITGYTDVQPNNRTALIEALKQGPVAVSSDASPWSFYGGGIFNKCTSYAINHAITLVEVGYDQALGQYFYTIANSWGTGWGEKGYMRIHMAAPNEEEVCGTDNAPYDGSACKDDPNPRTLACACGGLLYDSTYPTGIKFTQ